MKSLGNWLMYPVLLSMLAACGKANESGKSPINFPINGNPISIGNTPYNYQGVNLEQVLIQNPCINGYGGMTGMNQPYTNQRTPAIEISLTGFKTQIPPGDIYVGVTSYGDVAAVVGRAVGQPPVFIGYLCPRSFTQQGTGQLMGVEVGANTPRCLFKPITKATVVFPGGATAEFRWLDGGNSQKQPFAPPVCLGPI
ncbi:MAG TPA: MGMT family protein [Bacteriovoracaceae bacterium]|nr:MGMT family protein [Bacteriovoracaceae bacterium]